MCKRDLPCATKGEEADAKKLIANKSIPTEMVEKCKRLGRWSCFVTLMLDAVLMEHYSNLPVLRGTVEILRSKS